MKKAIVNVSTANGWYARGQQRLIRSIQQFHDDIAIYAFLGENKVNAPLHKHVPYAFKPFALDYLRNKGYELIIWLDASMFIVKSMNKIWNVIENKGYLMEESGHWLSQWCNDRALSNMNITREQASKIPMYSAGLTGLNMQFESARLFLNEWLKFAKDGQTFCGSHNDHRHDMSVASYLADKYNFKFETGGTYLAYIGGGYSQPKESAIIYLQGMA